MKSPSFDGGFDDDTPSRAQSMASVRSQNIDDLSSKNAAPTLLSILDPGMDDSIEHVKPGPEPLVEQYDRDPPSSPTRLKMTASSSPEVLRRFRSGLRTLGSKAFPFVRNESGCAGAGEKSACEKDLSRDHHVTGADHDDVEQESLPSTVAVKRHSGRSGLTSPPDIRPVVAETDAIVFGEVILGELPPADDVDELTSFSRTPFNSLADDAKVAHNRVVHANRTLALKRFFRGSGNCKNSKSGSPGNSKNSKSKGASKLGGSFPHFKPPFRGGGGAVGTTGDAATATLASTRNSAVHRLEREDCQAHISDKKNGTRRPLVSGLWSIRSALGKKRPVNRSSHGSPDFTAGHLDRWEWGFVAVGRGFRSRRSRNPQKSSKRQTHRPLFTLVPVVSLLNIVRHLLPILPAFLPILLIIITIW